MADADERAATYLSLSVAVVIAFLVWNRTSSLWFDEGRERALAGSLDATTGSASQPSGTRVVDFLLRLLVLEERLSLSGLGPGS